MLEGAPNQRKSARALVYSRMAPRRSFALNRSLPSSCDRGGNGELGVDYSTKLLDQRVRDWGLATVRGAPRLSVPCAPLRARGAPEEGAASRP